MYSFEESTEFCLENWKCDALGDLSRSANNTGIIWICSASEIILAIMVLILLFI